MSTTEKQEVSSGVLDVSPSLSFDETAGVYELHCITSRNGEELEREWVGAFDSPSEARVGWHKWISSGQ